MQDRFSPGRTQTTGATRCRICPRLSNASNPNGTSAGTSAINEPSGCKTTSPRTRVSPETVPANRRTFAAGGMAVSPTGREPVSLALRQRICPVCLAGSTFDSRTIGGRRASTSAASKHCQFASASKGVLRLGPRDLMSSLFPHTECETAERGLLLRGDGRDEGSLPAPKPIVSGIWVSPSLKRYTPDTLPGAEPPDVSAQTSVAPLLAGSMERMRVASLAKNE